MHEDHPDHKARRDVAVLFEKVAAANQAVGLQAAEYARRLAILNDEHSRLEAFQAHAVSHEKFEAFQAAQNTAATVAHERQALRSAEVDRRLSELMPTVVYDERHEALATRVAELDEWRANLTGRLAVTAVLGAILIAVASSFITHLL